MFLESAVAEGPEMMRGHLELDHTLASGVLLPHSSGLGMEKPASFSLPSPLHFFFFSAQCKPESCQSLFQLNFQLPKWPDLFPVPFMP